MKVAIAKCAEPSCDWPGYTSHEIKHPRHELNAIMKATRQAQEHCTATGHDVNVDGADTHSVVAQRCAFCSEKTPGTSRGVCDSEECLKKASEL